MALGRFESQEFGCVAGLCKFDCRIARAMGAGADFNMEPSVLQSSRWLALVKGKIVATAAPTCGKKTYDYWVVSLPLSGCVLGAALVDDAGFHPHCPVRVSHWGP